MSYPFRNTTTQAKRWIAASIASEYFLAVFTVGMRSTHNDCFIEVIEGLPLGSEIVLVERNPRFKEICFVVEHKSLEWVMPGEFIPYRQFTMRLNCAVIDSQAGGRP